MKKNLIITAALALMSYSLYAGDASGEWLTDFDKAKAEASAKKKPILAVFSGSDWCGWCIKLDKEVWEKKEFKKYAEDSLVLFLADFPSSKKLPEETALQNRKLSETYQVKGFPTVLLMDAQGKVIA